MLRTYSELSKLETFEDRFQYLKLNGSIGIATFGFDRYLNQALYQSARWKKIRNEVIIRDDGCDLGIDGYFVPDCILVHHMNPITIEDVEKERDYIFDPEFLICTSRLTHNAIHYGDENLLSKTTFVERVPNDTCPWKG